MSSIYTPCPQCNVVNRVDSAVAGGRTPVCSRCRSELRVHGAVSQVNDAGLEALATRTSRPVVADFWAEWCGPCKAFAPVFAETATAMADELTFVKLDTEADPAAASRHRIQAIPTLLVLQDGRERGRRSGAMDAASFRQWLRSFT